MKQLFRHRYTSTGQTRTICRPLGYSREQELLFSRHFPGYGLLAARAFSVEHDFGFVQDWMQHQNTFQHTPGIHSLAQWMQTYTMMLQSDFMQPLMLLANDQPACLADIYFGQLHELSIQTSLQNEDYVLELLPSPLKKKNQPLLPLLIQTCLHYVFSFPDVQKIFCEPSAPDMRLNEAIQQSGFRYLRQLVMPYKTANLYEYSRAQFFQQFPPTGTACRQSNDDDQQHTERV